MTVIFLLSAAALSPASAQPQGVEVSLQVTVELSSPSPRKSQHHPPQTVVVWLTPANTPEIHLPFPLPRSFVLSQKDKQFIPHLLVVPIGSSVEFPNLDPFFHNVFSLFNGRRFDLGLYEAGRRRTVRFDHEGVSYIFCNIHPEMAAVIVSLGTPFYAISMPDGTVTLLDIPPGIYDLNFWSEDVSSTDAADARRRIHVTAQNLRIPPVVLRGAPSPQIHLNKFGEPYKNSDQPPY